MTKQDSQIIKGVAILMMLYLHLFNHPEPLVSSFCIINGVPLANILSRACHPVSFYLILGGVGLYSVWKSCRGTFKDNVKRVFILYVRYWIILLIFVTMGCFLRSEKYPGSLSDIIGNFTSFYTSYNGEYWFLFPYSILTLSAPFLFKLLNQFKWKLLLLSFIIGIGTSFLISRFGEKYLFNNMIIYNPLLCFHLLFPFILGATLAWTCYRIPVEKFLPNKRLVWIFIIAIFSIPCIIDISVFYSFYVLIFILFFNEAPKCSWVKKSLSFLGNHSMNMWLIHTWFAYYLFHDFIYGFKYPIVIYFVLLLLSLCTSICVNFISNPIIKLIKK